MKQKHIGLVTFIIILTAVVNASHVAATDYELGVTAGDTFIFKLKKASTAMKVSSNGLSVEFTTEGINITDYDTWETTTINEGEKFTLRIDKVSTIGNISTPKIETAIVYNGFEAEAVSYPADFFDVSFWDVGDFTAIGITFLIIFGASSGLDLEETMSSAITYSNDDWWTYLETNFNSLTANITGTDDLSADFSVETDNEEFGVFSKINLDTTENETTVNMSLKSRLVWEKATGVLFGIIMELNAGLDSSEGKYSMNMNYEITREGYSIEGFGNGGLIPSFELIYLLPVFGVLVVIYRRRK